MRTVLVFLLYFLLIILFIPLLFVCFLTGLRQPLLTAGKWAIHLGKWILGLDLKVEGLDKVDRKGTFIYMANHLSFLDGPLLFMLIPQPVRVILKKEIFRIPALGLGMSYVGFVPVDRKRMRGGKQSIEKAARLMRERGYSFLIFPEGTRSRDGRLQPFKRGGFFLALESQAPIIPITIEGTFELMPKGSLLARKGQVKVAFHPQVSAAGYDQSRLQKLMDEVGKRIKSGLDREPLARRGNEA